MNGVTMILPGDRPANAQTPFEQWVDRWLKRVPVAIPPASLPVPKQPATQKPQEGGSRQNPGASRPPGVYAQGPFCFGADAAICGRLSPGFARDACGAVSNLACLTLGVVVLLALAALAFVPQRKPGVGLAVVAVLLLGWAWRTGRLQKAAEAARGA